jgi:2'-5' RNA ligase
MDDLELALWLVPGKASEVALHSWIKAFAARFGGPVFPPHLTLLSGIRSEALGLAAAEAIRRSTDPVRLGSRAASGTEAFFRNLYLVGDSEPELRALHVRCATPAERPEEAEFLPHISLFYGRLTPAERELAMQEAERRLPVEMEFDAVELWSVRGWVESWSRQARVLLA